MELRTSGVPGLLDRDLGQELGAAVGQELAREGEPGAVGAVGAGAGGPAAHRSQVVQEPSTVLTSGLFLVEFNCLAKHTRPQGHLLS